MSTEFQFGSREDAFIRLRYQTFTLEDFQHLLEVVVMFLLRIRKDKDIVEINDHELAQK
jgi:hypothetical protein